MRLFPRLALMWLAVSAGFVAALCLGAQDYSPRLLWSALAAYDPTDPAQAIIREMRLPRAIAALVIGAALAVAGVVMQAMARNPLADPGLTGVNAGAALAVVLGLFWLGALPQLGIVGLALAGAALATVLVRLLAGGGDNTLRLPLAGAAFASLCMALVALIVLLNPEARNIYRFWMVGSLAMAQPPALAVLGPVAAVGILIAAIAARQIEAMMLGAEMGRALGLSVGRVLGLGLAAVALTAGASVAIAGPVGFIGLIAPHMARRAARGASLTQQVALACPVGAGLAVLADLAGRWLARPAEMQLGIVLAMIGAPAFMLLVRRMLREAA
ncbi:iron ABC transporter permease [Paracoccus sp. CPCC 101403]|uniref:Iron ABC transporter permease n=1 Tax=Paracoccus broussonetiae TaxID=3075834 RepID=A0ABU3E9I4_9RHOB|nr:iron ABC transporter permease [Paracoccus sp. CPCC 101403]MDT1060881.1 iron ABC transporter permease [Paracoccus sp. CPCC 101403]